MKPQQLEFAAFMSYKDQTKIDFTVFNNDLFLINGKTGSGKSTIFEAISFALYGEPSGEYRMTSDLRSDYASNDVRTYVKFTFDINGQIYTIERAPKQISKKSRGEGTVLRGSEAILTLPNGSVITNIGECNAKIESILGLKKEQFAQTVMIAQNDFMSLLNAKTETRELIYEKIFNTYKYRDFTTKLKDKFGGFKKQLKDMLLILNNELSSFNMNNEYKNYGMFLKNTKSDDAIINNIDQIYNDIEQYHIYSKTKLNAEKKQNDQITKQIEDTNRSLYSAKMENENILLYIDINKKYENLLTESKAIENLNKKCMLIQQSISLEIYEKDYHNTLLQLNEAKEKIAKRKHDDVDLENSIKLLELDKASIRKDALLRDTIIGKIKSINDSLDIFKQLKVKNNQLNTLKSVENTEINALSDQKLMYERLKEKIRKDKEDLANNKVSEMSIANKKEMVNNLKDKKNILTKILQESKEIADLTTQVNQFKNIVIIQDKNYKEKSNKYNEIFRKYCANIAGVLQGELVDGKPCPVCGSLTHYPVNKTVNSDVTQDDVNNAKRDCDIISDSLVRNSTEISKLNKNIEILKSDINRFKDSYNIDYKNIEDLSQSIRATIQECESLENEISVDKKELVRIEELIETSQANMSALEAQEKRIKELEKHINGINSQIAALNGEISSLKQNIKYQTEDEANIKINELKKQVIKIDQKISNIQEKEKVVNANYKSNKDAIKELQSIIQSLTIKTVDTETKFIEKLNSSILGSLDKYHYYLNLNDSLSIYRKEIEDYNNKKSKLEGEMDSLCKYKDKKIIDLQQFTSELNEYNIKLEQSDARLEDIASYFKHNSEIINKIKKQKETLKKLLNNVNMYSNLYNTASGQLNQKMKITFETYIQTVYFNLIIDKANLRFAKMTDNRYVLQSNRDKTGIKEKNALDITVFDYYTGKVRSASSLSGGESFMATLSLALGLSDVILERSGGIRLDSMFIDEGFGTLDDNCLANALNVLNNLSNGERLIGIISHVDELKELINKQICVKKDENGSSLQIIA